VQALDKVDFNRPANRFRVLTWGEPMRTEVPPDGVSKDNSTFLVTSGLGLGAYATGAAVVTGVICPICFVAAPAFAAAGVYQKMVRKRSDDPTPEAASTNRFDAESVSD